MTVLLTEEKKKEYDNLAEKDYGGAWWHYTTKEDIDSWIGDSKYLDHQLLDNLHESPYLGYKNTYNKLAKEEKPDFYDKAQDLSYKDQQKLNLYIWCE